MLDLLLATAKGELAEKTVEWSDESALTVVMASKGYPGSYEKGKPITGIELAQSIPGVTVYQAGTALTEDGTLVTAGGRVINVTAIADTFEEARAAFQNAWESLQPQITPAMIAEWRRHHAFTEWKYAMWDARCKMPTQTTTGRSRCFCGADISIDDTDEHVYSAHMAHA